MAESKEELRRLLKEESEKAGLKLNIQKTKIMVSRPITSWQIVGEKNGNSDRIYFLGFQNHYSHKIQTCLLLGRKAMTKLDSILKRRDITLPTKVHRVKAMPFPVVVYRYESRIIEKSKC